MTVCIPSHRPRSLSMSMNVSNFLSLQIPNKRKVLKLRINSQQQVLRTKMKRILLNFLKVFCEGKDEMTSN